MKSKIRRTCKLQIHQYVKWLHAHFSTCANIYFLFWYLCIFTCFWKWFMGFPDQQKTWLVPLISHKSIGFTLLNLVYIWSTAKYVTQPAKFQQNHQNVEYVTMWCGRWGMVHDFEPYISLYPAHKAVNISNSSNISLEE